HHALDFPDAGAGGGTESLLQHGAGHGRGAALAKTDGGQASRQRPVGLLPAGAGTHGRVWLAGPPLGDRAVPARGSAVPRGGTTGPAVVAGATVPRQGGAAQRGTGLLLFRIDSGASLDFPGRRWTGPRPRVQRHPLSGLRRGPAVVHGPAA